MKKTLRRVSAVIATVALSVGLVGAASAPAQAGRDTSWGGYVIASK